VKFGDRKDLRTPWRKGKDKCPHSAIVQGSPLGQSPLLEGYLAGRGEGEHISLALQCCKFKLFLTNDLQNRTKRLRICKRDVGLYNSPIVLEYYYSIAVLLGGFSGDRAESNAQQINRNNHQRISAKLPSFLPFSSCWLGEIC
jgi:hypothetical protein